MRTAAALLSVLLWMNARVHAGPKCGTPHLGGPAVPSLRVVGGKEAAYGSHPWLVSLQNRGSHFCAGAILTDRWIMTAAHCFTSVSKEFLGGLRVLVGEFDRRVVDEEEQVFMIKSVSVHEKYHHALPMNYDIALVQLDKSIQMGPRVLPICLPLPDLRILPWTSCVVGGWGRMMERGRLPAVLREVYLALVDSAKCKYVLQTVKGSLLSRYRAGQLQAVMTTLCAGPEGGGKDACQGDSGGPLVCPAGSGSAHWVALGITSWGKGCGRSWGNNSNRPPSSRGSPGIFTDVRLLLPWIKQKLREAEHQQGTTLPRLCSVRDGPVSDSEGVIRNPSFPGDHYDNNQLCLWSLSVPASYSILLEFDHFDVENDSYCRYDRLTVSAGTDRPVDLKCTSTDMSPLGLQAFPGWKCCHGNMEDFWIFCGHILPGSVLLQNSQNATLLFSSDINIGGSGFVVRHRAVKGHSSPGCGTIILIKDQGELQSPKYPHSYDNDCMVRWVVHAPQGHVVKLTFAEFALEDSERCSYDSLTVLGDAEGTEEIAVLCGATVPPPVLSYHSVMVLQFMSDSSITHEGFRASLTFIQLSDLHDPSGPADDTAPRVFTTDQQHSTSHDPAEQQSSSKGLRHQLAVDYTASEEIRASDVEDYSNESLEIRP